MRPSFRSKLFLAALATAVPALVVAGLLFADSMRTQTDERIEATLVAEGRLAADLLARTPPAAGGALSTAFDDEADRMGRLLDARVTLIGHDGRVLGDSSEPADAVAAMENHATRPEVLEARARGLGVARRHSGTLDIEMLYVALPVDHPQIAFVRLALPLSTIRQQLRPIARATLLALALALAGAGFIAWLISGRIGARVAAIAAVARRYAAGDLRPSGLDFGDDELGVVARALDAAVQEVARRLEELDRDRAQMEAMLSGMIEGVIVVDGAGRVRLANEAARRILRLDALPVGRHYLEVIRHPGVSDLISAALGGRVPDALQMTPPRDPSRAVAARAAPVAAGGGAVLVLHDITDLRRADRIRRDFVANISHELRTPLTAIRGYLEALAESDTSADDRRRFLDIVARHARRMERLVNDLLRLARLEGGQETVVLSSIDLRSLLDGVIADVAQEVEARHVHVDVRIAEGARTVRADAAKLHDAIRNLLANAVTYSPDGGTITLEAAAADGRVTLAVCDEGPGIPEADLPRIFERFYRVDKSRARDPGGTGLGLAIAKHLVGLHGGEIRAENRREGGAKFTITL